MKKKREKSSKRHTSNSSGNSSTKRIETPSSGSDEQSEAEAGNGKRDHVIDDRELAMEWATRSAAQRNSALVNVMQIMHFLPQVRRHKISAELRSYKLPFEKRVLMQFSVDILKEARKWDHSRHTNVVDSAMRMPRFNHVRDFVSAVAKCYAESLVAPEEQPPGSHGERGLLGYLTYLLRAAFEDQNKRGSAGMDKEQSARMGKQNKRGKRKSGKPQPHYALNDRGEIVLPPRQLQEFRSSSGVYVWQRPPDTSNQSDKTGRQHENAVSAGDYIIQARVRWCCFGEQHLKPFNVCPDLERGDTTSRPLRCLVTKHIAGPQHKHKYVVCGEKRTMYETYVWAATQKAGTATGGTR